MNAEDAESLKKRCARATNKTDGQSEVSRLIRSINLLWWRKRFSDALTEAQRAVSSYPKSGEASFVLGRTYLFQDPPNFQLADDAFKDAQFKKYDRPHLLEYWSLTKLKLGDIPGLLRITGRLSAPTLGGLALLYRLAGLYRLALSKEQQSDYAGAFIAHQRLMNEVVSAINENRADPVSANVNRLAAAVPNYLVDTAYQTFKRDSVDRIFQLAVDLTKLGYPPLHQIERLARDLVHNIDRRVPERNRLSQTTIRKRLEGLSIMRQSLKELLGPQHEIIVRLQKTTQSLLHSR